MNINVNLGSELVVDGVEPITLIGANGAGKTRFGAYLVSSFGYDRVSAQRLLSVADIAMQTPEKAKRNSEQQINQYRSNVSDPAQDLHAILAELKAEDVQSASDYRDKALEASAPIGPPDETKLRQLKRLWGMVFPGRELDLSGYAPRARWTDSSRKSDYYSASSMSDGERSAVYHIARLLRATPGPVIIDEPEIHFHPMLARRFWDLVEANRSDCRFIYITHDLAFGLSRRGRIGIVRGPNEVELLDKNADIPPELFESILGAASLSVVAERIVFCEGSPEKSVDISIYGAWFRAPKTAVVPVGSCETVRRAYGTFKDTTIIKNACPLAIVERDYWPDSYLQKLEEEGMHVLSTHEIEGILALPEIAEPIAEQLAIHNFTDRYKKFISNFQGKFSGIVLNKIILERAKRDIDVRLLGLVNKASPNADQNVNRANFVSAVNLASAVPDVGKLYDEHDNIVRSALGSGIASELLKIFPGKEVLGLLVQELGVTKDRYIELVLEALTQPDVGGKETLEVLRSKLVSALTPHLPSRE